MPTALARPWPSGPVVVSTPGVTPTSGWPGVLRVQLAEVLQLVDRQVVAGQMQQRVLQHRAVAVRQHEAVAIGPVRVGRIVAQVTVPQRDGDSAMPIGMPGWPELAGLDGVHGERADRVGHQGGLVVATGVARGNDVRDLGHGRLFFGGDGRRRGGTGDFRRGGRKPGKSPSAAFKVAA